MRIVIDLQAAQTASRFRGIGRYSLGLAQAIVRNRGSHEVVIALNGAFVDTIEPIRASFEGLLPTEQIRVWDSPGPVRECDAENVWRREVAERIREAFLHQLEPDLVFISSHFEGFGDDAVSSIGKLPSDVPVAVTLYDLIPLLNQDTYLTPNAAFQQHYLRKIGQLQRADLCLAISESSASEGRSSLDLESDAIVNISSDCDEMFKPLDLTPTRESELRKRFKLNKPFLMYSGGYDTRKNLPGLIRAFGSMPRELVEKHQLAIVGKLSKDHEFLLRAVAEECGLGNEDVVFTGYASDEDLVKLYNLSALYVFPSWHEGFGLPVLEAMRCGTAAICANTSSLPEVMEIEEAMFDPHDVVAMQGKIVSVLTDASVRQRLVEHGTRQARKFSWERSAKTAIASFEAVHAKRRQPGVASPSRIQRPNLTFVSPLPPERSGISWYSADLIRALARFYEITVVTGQPLIDDPWILANCRVRTIEWLRTNAHSVDRVLYHFGNSHFHLHMFDLLRVAPGAVVLHDFFISGLQAHRDISGFLPHAWIRELYASHGYQAVRERLDCVSWDDIVTNIMGRYPTNLSLLQQAPSIIVHSNYARELARQWYGEKIQKDWRVIPLLRAAAKKITREQARKRLDISDDAFVVTSFGILHSHKRNHRLLDAFLASRLVDDKRCTLIFVGENHGGDYGAALVERIRSSGLQDRIRITGWTDAATYDTYLAAADVGVQLRTLSRGETSAAVLDCLNYGLATIVNANGSMADFPSDAVCMLPDEFEDRELTTALETLYENGNLRHNLGATARQLVSTRHSPRACAEQYRDAIEACHKKLRHGMHALTDSIARLDHRASPLEHHTLAESLALTLAAPAPQARLFLDISATVRTGLRSGIERVARSLAINLLNSPPEGFRVEPVYLSDTGGRWHYRYARRFTVCNLFGYPADGVASGLVDGFDDIVEPQSGDVLLGLDLFGHPVVDAEANGLYTFWRNHGVSVNFVVFDLLPVTVPSAFPPDANASHAAWLRAITKMDGAICISRTVADELAGWLKIHGAPRVRPLKIGWFHLGADLENSVPTCGIPDDASALMQQLEARPTFLMVGTVEPRKGYLQAIEAFSALWEQNTDVNLVIVGPEGWVGLPDALRRSIPQTSQRLREHPQRGHKLFWLEGISDEYLSKVYAASSCLIAASQDEGFGLPLIEAAKHALPIIARDIPVFREVAGTHATYFSGSEPADLANAVTAWLASNATGQATPSADMPWLTWHGSTVSLQNVLFGDGGWYRDWMADGAHRFTGSDPRMRTHVGVRTDQSMDTTSTAGFLMFGPYLALPAGTYAVRIVGSMGERGASGTAVDIAVNGGATVLAEGTLDTTAPEGLLAVLPLDLESACTDLEVRVKVTEACDLSISLIEVVSR
ncbi:MAG: glycosyltransferase [Burkholderia gladioli]